MKYIIDHISAGTPHKRRPTTKMDASYITIHNTGNPRSSAEGERGWLENPNNNRTASFHIAIDDNKAIECIPLNEVAYHAGDKEGNHNSIGIEICESGNYHQTMDYAVSLVAKMLKKRGWGIDRLKRHYDWSGKICPRLMYDEGTWLGWELFKKKVQEKMKKQVDGVCWIDYEGKELNGVIIDGVSYAPVRLLGNALGLQVGWNGKENMVTLKKPHS